MKTTLVVAASLLATLTTACQPADATRPMKRRTVSQANAIVGGTVVTNYEFPEVVYIEGPGWICTGTLIDHHVVLTAAHCVEGGQADDYYVCGGDDPYGEGCYWINPAESIHTHPDYDPQYISSDIGIIVLADDPDYGSPQQQDPNLKPIPYLAVDNADVYEEGTTFTAVGFGITGNDDQTNPKKRKVDLSIKEVWLDVFEYGTSTQNTCSGDSGGPALKEIDGDLHVIGIVSYGDQNCTQFGGDSRTDYNPFEEFIESFAGAGGGGGPGPGPGDDDDDDDGATPGGDDDDDDGKGNGADDSVFGCSVAHTAASGASPLAFLALAFASLVAVRRRR